MSATTTQPAALITGAGGGIGRAIAIALAGIGYRLALVGRTESKLRQTAEQLATFGKVDGRDVLILPSDVADAQSAERAVASTVGKFGRLDALINNAGFAPAAGIEQMSVEQWRQVIDVNLSAVFYLCRAAWPALRQAGEQTDAVIVNISSVASRDPFTGLAAYGAAKAGVNIMGLAMAREGASQGIRVHTVAPGATETDMFRTLMSHEQFPTERTMAPAEIASVVTSCVRGDLRYSSGEVIYLQKII